MEAVHYDYKGVTPLALDADGRITRFASSSVPCFWPTTDDSVSSSNTVEEPEVARQPLPGVTLDPGGGCTAESREAIAGAAAVGAADRIATAHWVRDGDLEDGGDGSRFFRSYPKASRNRPS